MIGGLTGGSAECYRAGTVLDVCMTETIMDPVLDVCVAELIMNPVLDVCVTEPIMDLSWTSSP